MNDIKHIEKLEKEISHRTSYMSNAKWFKLFNKIEESRLKIGSAHIKFLMENRIFDFRFGGHNETGFDDVGALGPFQFREIEWISIPKIHELERWNRNEKLQSEILAQPIDEIEKIINTVGKLMYEKTDNGLKIYGYKD